MFLSMFRICKLAHFMTLTNKIKFNYSPVFDKIIVDWCIRNSFINTKEKCSIIVKIKRKDNNLWIICEYSKIDSNSWYEASTEKCAIFETDKNTRFSNSTITNQHHLEENKKWKI